MPAMTLNLPDEDWGALEALAARHVKTKTAVIRDSLALYAVLVGGAKVYVEGEDGEKSRLVVPGAPVRLPI